MQFGSVLVGLTALSDPLSPRTLLSFGCSNANARKHSQKRDKYVHGDTATCPSQTQKNLAFSVTRQSWDTAV